MPAAEIKQIIFERGGPIMSKFCRNCGVQLKPDVKFCAPCGVEAQVTGAQTLAVSPVGATVKMAANASFASATAGESCFTHSLPGAGEISAAIGPLKVLFQGLSGLFRGFGSAIKDKKRLIPALMLALLWFILTLLPLLGINPMPVKWLSFLTFAGGGTSNGITGLVGGVVGKGVFAYFLMSLVIPLTRGQKPFAGVGRGIKQFFQSIGAKSLAQLAPLLLGTGAALIGYNFITGNASIQNSMVGIAALLLSLRALSNKAGFLRGFFLSFFKRVGVNSTLTSAYVNRLITGWTSGFAIGVVISSLKIGSLSLLFGAILLLAAVVLGFVSRGSKEVAS